MNVKMLSASILFMTLIIVVVSGPFNWLEKAHNVTLSHDVTQADPKEIATSEPKILQTTEDSLNTSVSTETVNKEKVSKAIATEDKDQDNCSMRVQLTPQEYVDSSNAYINSLAGSSDINKALAYSLYSELDEETSRLDRALAFHQRFGDNELITLEIIRLCANLNDEKCEYSLIGSLTESFKNNTAIWFEAVLFYAARKDDERVLDTLLELKKSSYYNGMMGQRVQLYIDRMEEAGNSNVNQNFIGAMGHEAARAEGWNHLMKWCVANSNQPQYMDACKSLGDDLFQMGKTGSVKYMGLMLQDIESKVKNTQDVSIETGKKLAELNSDYAAQSELLRNPTESALRTWISQLDTLGPLQAAKQLVADGSYSNNNGSDDETCGW